MIVRPRTVIPGTVAGRSMLLSQAARPYTVEPRTLGAPDWEAQRFYFRASTPAEVSPEFDGAWENTTDSPRRFLAPSPLASDTITDSAYVTWTAGQERLDRQLVGPMMRGGVSFAGATLTAVIRCRESNADDNVVSRLGFRIVSADGATVRAVLLAVGAYGSQTEYISGTTGHIRILAQAEALASYVTQPGDRPVVELGWTDVSGTSPGATQFYGSSEATDYPETEGQPAVVRNAWLQITPPAA